MSRMLACMRTKASGVHVTRAPLAQVRLGDQPHGAQDAADVVQAPLDCRARLPAALAVCTRQRRGGRRQRHRALALHSLGFCHRALPLHGLGFKGLLASPRSAPAWLRV